MARERRMIARSAFTSKKLKRCCDNEFLLFIHLVLEADDEGRGEGEPDSLHMTARNRKWSEEKIEKMMEHLTAIGLVCWYTNNGSQFYEVVDFLEYQQGSWHGKVAKPSKIPSPSDKESVTHQLWLTATPVTVEGYVPKRREVREEKGREAPLSISEDTPEPIRTWAECLYRISGFHISVENTIGYLTEKQSKYPARIISSALESFIDKKLYGEKLTSSPLGQLTTYIKKECDWAKGRGENIHMPKPITTLPDDGEPTTDPIEAAKIVRDMRDKYFSKEET